MVELKILLAEDHPLFLAGMQSIIANDKNLTIVASAVDGKEAISFSRELRPDIIIMDISMPNIDGIEATRQIVSESPDTKIIALSIHTGKRFVDKMLNAGAMGYLVKDTASDELVKAIWKVHNGEMFLSSRIADFALSNDASAELPEDRNILQTKLYRPKVSEKTIFRNTLVKQLENSIDKPLSLISAGAGYGKSIAVSQWLSTTKSFYCWISLDDEHNEMRIFLTYLKEALEQVFPGRLSKFGDIIRGGELPAVSSIAKILINELDNIKKSFIVVLDDFHRIIDKQVIELITLLIQFPPEMLHLCIITRRDPTLNLVKLRAQNRLTEIRMTDLAFSIEEIGILAKKIRDINIPLSTSEILFDKTEGWVVGICLSLLSMDKSKEVDDLNKALLQNMQSSSDYLVEEVLSAQIPWIKELLMLCSVLNRFSAELIDEIIGSGLLKNELSISGSEFITKIQQTNLFIVELDENKKWFRHHHLFHDLLKVQLQKYLVPEKINSLHLSIAKWFDKNGFMGEAVEHAIEANDYNVAVDLVCNYRYKMMEHGKIYRFNQLMDLLPQNIIETSPVLLTSKSFIMEYKGQMAEWIEFKEKAKLLIENSSVESHEKDSVRGEIATIEGEIFLLSGDGKSAFESSKIALELLPNNAIYAKSYALGTQIVSYQLLNNIDNVDEISTEKTLRSNFSLARIHGWYSIAYAMEGNMQRLKEHGQKFIELSEKNQLHESVTYGKYFLSVALYLSMQDDKAEAYLESVLDDPFLARPHYLVNCAFMLASIYIQKDKIEKADQLMNLVIQHTTDANNTLVTAVAKAMCVEIALKAGNIEKAMLLDSEQETYVFYPPIWFNYVPQLTPVKLKLAINTAESIEEALQMLSEIEGQLRKSNKKTILIDVLILQAVALKAKKNEKDALLKIDEALSMSCIGNCIRTFVDYGDNLKELLNKLLNTSAYSTHIRDILDAITDRENSTNKIAKNKQDKTLGTFKPNPTIGSLSVRELEITKLVTDGLRNKEIAAQLFISEDTVKKHLYNAYKKLGINNRIELVSKALDLNISKAE